VFFFFHTKKFITLILRIILTYKYENIKQRNHKTMEYKT